MNKRERKKIYRRLAEDTAGIWNKGDGLAYQETLREEWDNRVQSLLQKGQYLRSA